MNLFMSKFLYIKQNVILIGFFLLFFMELSAQQNSSDNLEIEIDISNPDKLNNDYNRLFHELLPTDIDKAKSFASELIAISNGDNEMLGNGCFNMASLYGVLNNQDSVHFYLRRAIDSYKKVDDSTLIAKIPDQIRI